jgi:hypothetical protein
MRSAPGLLGPGRLAHSCKFCNRLRRGIRLFWAVHSSYGLASIWLASYSWQLVSAGVLMVCSTHTCSARALLMGCPSNTRLNSPDNSFTSLAVDAACHCQQHSTAVYQVLQH